jgi:F-type H+-transporting ATPase subunit gamma
MNRARQDAITTEIMEIVGGAEALRSSQVETREPDHFLIDELRARAHAS